MPLSLLTQNCHGLPVDGYGRRFGEIARIIGELMPDVVFLQEVIFTQALSYFRHPDYAVFYSPGRILVGGGLVTLVKKSLTPQPMGFERFASRGNVVSRQWSDWILGKGFLAVRIHGGITLVNTHLLCVYAESFREDAAQASQLAQLQSFIAEHQPCILGGDLNFNEDTPYYDRIVPHMTDITRGMGYTRLSRQEKFDSIWTSGFPVASFRATFVDYRFEVSNHKGILCEIEMNAIM